MENEPQKWTEEWLKLAAKVLASGATMDRIADAINNVFNVKITRNSVAGKISRCRAAGDVRFTQKQKPDTLNGKPLDYLFKAWQNGVGANEIADYYGVHRNTIPRRAIEYGLRARTQKDILKSQREKRDAGKPARINHNIYKPRNIFMNPEARQLGFLELKRGQCHFPIGDGPFIFCGADVKPGSDTPYCNICKKVVYRPRDSR